LTQNENNIFNFQQPSILLQHIMMLSVWFVKAWQNRRVNLLLETRIADENNGIDISVLWIIKDNIIFICYSALFSNKNVPTS